MQAEIVKQIPALRRLAILLTRNEETSADLTQETLAKAWQARTSFVLGTDIRAWLFTIMRNHYRSEMRRAWRQVSWDQVSAERVPAPKDEQLWTIELEDTVRAIGTLSKSQRDALILAGVGGFSNKDTGTIVHCRLAAVKSRVSRARNAVRSMLEGKRPLKKIRRNEAEELVRQLHVLTGRVAMPARLLACNSSPADHTKPVSVKLEKPGIVRRSLSRAARTGKFS